MADILTIKNPHERGFRLAKNTIRRMTACILRHDQAHQLGAYLASFPNSLKSDLRIFA